MPNVIFAYNSTATIPAAGAQRQTFNVVFADDTRFETDEIVHDMFDRSIQKDVLGSRLKLSFTIGHAILKIAANVAFFKAFLRAPHRWAVYGDFKDTANSGDDNLCKCYPDPKELEVTIRYDMSTGYVLLSERLF